MTNFEALILALDDILDTKRKRHILGGLLLSISLMFLGMSVTTMTIREEENDDE